MTDLLSQLRTYGRQLEAEWARPATGEPSEVAAESDETPIFESTTQMPAVGRDEPDPARDGHRRPAGRRARWTVGPGRSAWLAVAAVTAVLSVAVSLLVPVKQSEEGDMDKRSGVVLGVCIFLAGCTTGTQGTGGGTSASGLPASSAAATSSGSAAAAGPPTLKGGDDIPVEPGTYVIDTFTVPVEITIPGGWTAFDDLVLHGPEGATLSFSTGAWDTYSNACQWMDTRVDVGPGVSDLVSALVAQEPTTNSDPRQVTVGGFAGTELVVSTPPDFDGSTCYGGEYTIMVNDQLQQTYLEADAPRTFRILDINGQRGIIGTWSSSSISAATQAQLDAMLASLKFG